MLDPQIENLLKGLCTTASDSVFVKHNSIYHYGVLAQTALYCPSNKLYVTLNHRGCYPLMEVDFYPVLEKEKGEDNSLNWKQRTPPWVATKKNFKEQKAGWEWRKVKTEDSEVFSDTAQEYFVLSKWGLLHNSTVSGPEPLIHTIFPLYAHTHAHSPCTLCDWPLPWPSRWPSRDVNPPECRFCTVVCI